MKSEFDKFFERIDHPANKTLLENTWHAAQRALLRTIKNPPNIPNAGDSVIFRSLCHPRLIGEKRKVLNVSKFDIGVYEIVTQDAEGMISSGILSEVEVLK